LKTLLFFNLSICKSDLRWQYIATKFGINLCRMAIACHFVMNDLKGFSGSFIAECFNNIWSIQLLKIDKQIYDDSQRSHCRNRFLG